MGDTQLGWVWAPRFILVSEEIEEKNCKITKIRIWPNPNIKNPTVDFDEIESARFCNREGGQGCSSYNLIPRNTISPIVPAMYARDNNGCLEKVAGNGWPVTKAGMASRTRRPPVINVFLTHPRTCMGPNMYRMSSY